jgi:glycosyltransferase involved in cell wall biosynthesis
VAAADTGPQRRRVLIVSRESPPSLGPPTIRVAKLAKYLPDFGWEPVILSAPTDHAWFVDHELEADVGSVKTIRVPRLFARAIHPTAGVGRGPNATEPTMSRARRTVVRLRSTVARDLLVPDGSVLWAIPAARQAVRLVGEFDAVLTSAPPYSTHLVGNMLCARQGLPWVADYRDNWTTNPMHRRNPVLHALNKRLERRFMATAGAVVVVSDAAGDEIAAEFPGVASRTFVAMNGYDPDDIPPRAPRPNEFEIVHAGTLDERRDPRPFLEALRRLAVRDSEFAESTRLHLIGVAPEWAVQAARSSLAEGRVTYDGLLSHREAMIRASRAAVLLGLTTAAEAGTAGLTSKVFEYLALERPVLMLAPDGPARALISTSGAGLVAGPDDVPGIEAALARLHHEWASGVVRAASPDVLARLTRQQTARHVALALDAACDRQGSKRRR